MAMSSNERKLKDLGCPEVAKVADLVAVLTLTSASIYNYGCSGAFGFPRPFARGCYHRHEIAAWLDRPGHLKYLRSARTGTIKQAVTA